MSRIEEIRAANHQGDVAAKDIAWLCDEVGRLTDENKRLRDGMGRLRAMIMEALGADPTGRTPEGT